MKWARWINDAIQLGRQWLLIAIGGQKCGQKCGQFVVLLIELMIGLWQIDLTEKLRKLLAQIICRYGKRYESYNQLDFGRQVANDNNDTPSTRLDMSLIRNAFV